MLGKMGCIHMYISFVYIDTYAISLLMLLSPVALDVVLSVIFELP